MKRWMLSKMMYLNVVLSISAIGGALDKYALPQQMMAPSVQQTAPVQVVTPSITVSPDIFTQFEEKIKTLSPEERREVKKIYQEKLGDSVKKKEFERAGYYQKLLDILNKYEEKTK